MRLFKRLVKALCQITMRIDDAEADITSRILPGKILQERGFPSTRLADQVEVHEPVSRGYAERCRVTVSAICQAKDGSRIHRSIFGGSKEVA